MYLRPIVVATDDQARMALTLRQRILDLLAQGYETGDAEEGRFIAEARQIMFELDGEAERLASQGLGIPFFR